MMQIQLIRHATLLMHINGKNLLADPFLADVGTFPPIPFTTNQTPIPLVALPAGITAAGVVAKTDAVLVTHMHQDHWDPHTQELLPKNTPVYCQPADEATVRNEQGFTNAMPVGDTATWNGVTIHRTNGRHGAPGIAEKIGPVSGYVLNDVYIAGDTIWCDDVKQAIDTYHPKHIIVNGGGGRMDLDQSGGHPIVMNIKDVITVCKYAPEAKVYVVHLENTNHSRETRADIKKAIAEAGLSAQCFVPADGETFLTV
ncbi:MBL fold metallo-hydrolase [Niastella yeongjuensis]|nr:MBL fold metallo-hydrolase [Niastella yeongjuensis]